MKIERMWAMPNKWTFTIKPIKQLLDEEIEQPELWADPFAGKNSPAFTKNDLNPEICENGMDALVFLKSLKGPYAGILFDPPYSITQAAQCYKSFGKEKLAVHPSNMKYWATVKDEMARLIMPGGKAICFGWNSMGLGKNRGFEMTKILMVAHGGSKNDTICTVETKLPCHLKSEEKGWEDELKAVMLRHFTYEEIHAIVTSTLSQQKREIVERIKALKMPVETMKHDLKGQCDFERNNTINDALKAINDITK